MKLKILFGVVACLLLISYAGYNFMYGDTVQQENSEEQRLFQGPVQDGYDLEHFKQTGETRLIENG